MRDLKSLRLRRGLSQADLSARSGVSEFTISEIEAGKRPNARPSTARKLAAGLGVDVADLYGEALEAPKAEAPSSPEPHSDEGSGRRRRASLPDFKDFLQQEADSWYLALPDKLYKQLWEEADTKATRWRLYEQIRREHAAVVKKADEVRDRLGEVQRIKLDDIWMRRANTRMVEATELVRQKTDA
ncbi:MAG: helix-turn-helix domain-containing protein [Actinomycetota bacterium]|nr:helix-turn-helix domain-containing protein [Actinomycetota bacterium]